MGRDGDRGQPRATLKCIISNACNTAGDGDRGQAPAKQKCLLSNAGHTAGNGDGGQARAMTKCPLSYTSDDLTLFYSFITHKPLSTP